LATVIQVISHLMEGPKELLCSSMDWIPQQVLIS
jgi:hypothetical protein